MSHPLFNLDKQDLTEKTKKQLTDLYFKVRNFDEKNEPNEANRIPLISKFKLQNRYKKHELVNLLSKHKPAPRIFPKQQELQQKAKQKLESKTKPELIEFYQETRAKQLTTRPEEDILPELTKSKLNRMKKVQIINKILKHTRIIPKKDKQKRKQLLGKVQQEVQKKPAKDKFKPVLENIKSFKPKSRRFNFSKANVFSGRLGEDSDKTQKRTYELDPQYRVLVETEETDKDEDLLNVYDNQRSLDEFADLIMKELQRTRKDFQYADVFVNYVNHNQEIEELKEAKQAFPNLTEQQIRDEGFVGEEKVLNLFGAHVVINTITKQRIMNQIETLFHQHSPVTESTDGYIWFITGFELSYFKTPSAGGCNTSKKDHKFTHFSVCVYDPKVSAGSNDCGLRCLQVFMKEHKLETPRYASTIRKYLNIPFKKAIHFEDWPKICNYYKVNINIYDHKKNLVFNYNVSDDLPTMNLLLMIDDTHIQDLQSNDMGHYVLIRDNIKPKYAHCEGCGYLLPPDPNKRKHHNCRNTLAWKNKDEHKFMYASKNKVVSEFTPDKDIYSLDFETMPINGKHKCYACGIVQGLDKNTIQIFQGKKTLEKTVDYLVNIPAEKDQKGNMKNKYCIAFNGANFDWHFILSKLNQRGIQYENLFINNRRILSLTIKHNNVTLWDIGQHIGGSLKNALKSFDCDVAKGDFNHFKMKQWSDAEKYKKEWEPYLVKDIMGLAELNKKYRSITTEILQNESLPKLEPLSFLTLPQMGLDIWRHTTSQIPIKKGGQKEAINELIHIPTERKLLKAIRSATYGGRTYPLVRSYVSKQWNLFKPYYENQTKLKMKLSNSINEQEKQTYKEMLDQSQNEVKKLLPKLTDYVFNGDITSLYPTAMRYFEYPLGPARVLEEFDSIKESLNKMETQKCYSLLKVDMKNETGKKKIIAPIPRPKYDHLGNRIGVDWNLEDICGEWYTHIDIEHAIKHGYKITKIHEGYYWEGSGNIFKKYIDMFFNIKAEQDINKEKLGYLKEQLKLCTNDLEKIYIQQEIRKTPYNKALRACCKLFMNSLYGKMLQRPMYEETKVVNNYADFIKFWRKMDYIKEIVYLDNGMAITGVKSEDDQSVNSKPNHIGAFLLSYSRRIMMSLFEDIDPSLESHLFTYSDTDSAHIHRKTLETLKNRKNPHTGKYWLDTGLGCLSNDYDDDAKLLFERNWAPKNYFNIYVTNKGELLDTRKNKGIPQKLLEQYSDYWTSAQDIVMKDNHQHIKKAGFKTTKKQKEDGVKAFDVIAVPFSKTWRPKWQNGTSSLKDNLFYPKGYDFE